MSAPKKPLKQSEKSPEKSCRKGLRGHGVRGLADQDYVNKLSPEERRWLEDFNQSFYTGKKDARLTPKQQTEAYARRRAQNNDLWNHARRVNAPAEACPEWLEKTHLIDSSRLNELASEGDERPASKYQRRLGPEDYRPAVDGDAEQLMVELMDLAKTGKKSRRGEQ